MAYRNLDSAFEQKIIDDINSNTVPLFATDDNNAIRRTRITTDICRPSFTRDAEAILHIPYYNRYNDKTQVFSFYKNDDISIPVCSHGRKFCS